MLLRFFEFVREEPDKYWIHQRMQNLTYGFEHLEHRSRYLGNPDPSRLPFDNRLDLSARRSIAVRMFRIKDDKLGPAEWSAPPARGRSIQE